MSFSGHGKAAEHGPHGRLLISHVETKVLQPLCGLNINEQHAVTFVQTCTLSMVRNKHHSLL